MKHRLLAAALTVLLFTVLFAACAYAAELCPIEINPADVDLNNGSFCLTVRDADQIEKNGYFTAELFLEDRYDAEQVKALAPGDTVQMNGATWTVEKIVVHEKEYPDSQDVYEVYPVEEYYGYLVFSPTADGTYIAVIDDWVPVTPAGEIRIMMPLPDRFAYVRISAGEEEDPVGAGEFVNDLLTYSSDGFTAWNTSCVMEDGVLVSVTSSSYPWGPEEGWPGDTE